MRRAQTAVVLLVAFVVLSVVATPALADQRVIGSPDVSLFSPDNELSPGEEATLPLYISNVGRVQRAGPAEHVDRVTTARGLTFRVRDGNVPLDVATGRYPVGSVPEGTQGPYSVSVTVAGDAEPGTYRLPVDVSYSYTSQVEYGSDPPEYTNNDRSVTRYVEVEVTSDARFRIVDTAGATRVGGQGNVTLTVQNVGREPARDASVAVTSGSDEVTLGTASASSRAFAGEWQSGANRTFTFATRVSNDAVQREYPLTATVTYDDPDGIQRTSRDLTTGVVPLPEQTFGLDSLSASLHVGEQGSVEGVIRNTGPATVENAVLQFGETSPNLRPVESAVALGRLEPDETASFAVDVVVAEGASAGTRQLNLTVRSRDSRGTLQFSDPLEPVVSVGAERDWLAVTPGETTFEIDTDNRMTATIENVQEMPLRDVQVRLEATQPFTSASTTAYVDRLAPGQSATVAFGVTVSDDAVPTNASVALNATADRPDGTTIDAGRYLVPVTVTEGSGPGNVTLFVGGIVVVGVLLVAGWWWLRR